MKKSKIKMFVLISIAVIISLIISLALLGTVVQATGLVDDTINTANEYSKYALDNYQLDFYVDNSWGWLPWNWGDGIGKQVMYGLYAITNFIWTISLYLSNATGYLIQEAYKLDFISQTANAIGKNIQTIAGINSKGFTGTGFYSGFLLILILVLGIYVAYVGMLKRETTKAIRAVLNFVMVFIISASFIAYAPDYIAKVNDFSRDVSNASLTVGTKIILPNSESKGKDSVDMIRDSLFSIQVKQPWLLLQYDNSDIHAIGKDRVEKLLSASPKTNNGEDREKVVIEEIENKQNTNLTITKTMNRLGMVFFLFIFNIGISIFVFLLTGIMIFSQVLFIVYAMFLPISFLLSMIPTFDGMSKRAITKLFNVIMARAGITLIITVAFSISTMLYSLSASSPFFLIAFLQVVTFAGIYFKLNDLMSMFSLKSNDTSGMTRQVLRRPKTFLQRQARNAQRKVGGALALIGASSTNNSTKSSNPKTPNSSAHERNKTNASTPKTLPQKLGQSTGSVVDTKDRFVDNASLLKEKAKAIPTNVKYGLHKSKSQAIKQVKDFQESGAQTRKQNQTYRSNAIQHQRDTIAKKRLELDKKQFNKSNNLEPVNNSTKSRIPTINDNKPERVKRNPIKKEQSNEV